MPRDAGAAGWAGPGLPGDCYDHRRADWNRDVALGPRPPQGDRDAWSAQVTMTENDRLLLNAYIDGELDPAHVLEFDQRLSRGLPRAGGPSRIEALRGAMRA